jgi:hypothetical protein
MRQITEQESIAIHDCGEWKDWTDEEIVKFQLFQDRLAIPFSRFHQAVEKVLGRSVWTHEFGSRGRLEEEYLGIREKPTFEEICALIPADKLIVVGTD